MLEVPLQVFDKFVQNYNVGQALLVLFVLSIPATALQSTRVFAANAVIFGFVFLLTPASLAPFHYKLVGLALLVVGPMLYVVARR